VDFADVADGAARDVLVSCASSVLGVALIPHLGDDFGVVLCLLREMTRFVHRPAEWLLDIDMLAGVHRE